MWGRGPARDPFAADPVDTLVTEIARAGHPLSVREAADRLGCSSAGALLQLREGLRRGRIIVDEQFRIDAADTPR